MRVESAGWSGEGTFTQMLLDHLQVMDGIDALRVEDAPASRSEADYNFVSNEIFVVFATEEKPRPDVRFGFFKTVRSVREPRMNLQDLESRLTAIEDVGAPDYSDEGMLQYLRTERIVPPYQTRGYKLVELVRVYRSDV